MTTWWTHAMRGRLSLVRSQTIPQGVSYVDRRYTTYAASTTVHGVLRLYIASVTDATTRYGYVRALPRTRVVHGARFTTGTSR
jgi:hypothetical protein